MIPARFCLIACAVMHGGCQGDRFDVQAPQEHQPGGDDDVTDTQGDDDAATATDHDVGESTSEEAEGSGSGSSPGTGGAAFEGDGSGGAGESPWEGELRGPSLSDLDTTMGGFNADLSVPEPCEDFPVAGCAHVTGMVGGAAVTQNCFAESFELESGVLTCSGEGFSLWLALSGFVGAPPSDFNMVADSGMHVIGYSSEAPSFASHAAGSYAIEQDYEQVGVRAVGVRYSLVSEVSEETFVSMVFTLTFSPRPTCPTCPEIRLRAALSAHTGSVP